jgi:hypothetical protein
LRPAAVTAMPGGVLPPGSGASPAFAAVSTVEGEGAGGA